ncbi:transcriptional regulator [Ochrobactrum sp. POC9]|uniref:Response regulator transcription factor n=1 Tax=Brucella tritici TaxID=94626 RepID=A0A6L3YS77_9HYPH|nr:response regulator transcription factor [Brucella tritici]PWU77236.1 transcriptional regulator [Ochrobactrum sp. POC9]
MYIFDATFIPTETPAVNINVSICTQDPQTYLILGHILSVAGYNPNLLQLPFSTDFSLETIPYAILFDTSENTDPIIELCASIKRNSMTESIILVALVHPCNELTFLDFLKSGFDECFPHPFTPERVLSFLQDRRPVSTNTTSSTLPPRKNTFGKLDMSPEERTLRHGEVEVQLPPIEFRILQGFVDAPGQVMKREQIIKMGWPPHHYVQPRTVDVHVGNLRRRLRKLTGKNMIRTVHTTGYAFDYSR